MSPDDTTDPNLPVPSEPAPAVDAGNEIPPASSLPDPGEIDLDRAESDKLRARVARMTETEISAIENAVNQYLQARQQGVAVAERIATLILTLGTALA